MMKFKDFGWDDIVLEAPTEAEGGGDELSATDYDDADNLEVEEAPDDELQASDYDEELNNEDDTTPPEDDATEDTNDGLDDPGEENSGVDNELNSNETQEDEQTVNDENDNINGQQNKYLIHDFIELFNRQEEIIDKLRRDKKMNSFISPTFRQVKHNLEKLRDVTYDYITDKFVKETYVSNLYQFNLIIQALNINVQMLEEIQSKVNGGKGNKKTKK